MSRQFKTLLVAAAASAMLAGGAAAQQKSLSGLPPECIKYLSYYQDDYKLKRYDDALRNWRHAFALCPGTASQNMYVHGTTLMTRRLRTIKDPAEREAAVDTVLLLQDRRAEAFPKKRTDILNNKGLYMVNYRGTDKDYLLRELQPIADELGAETDNTILVNLFTATVALYRDGRRSADDVLECYSRATGLLDAKHPEDEKEAAAVEKARGSIGAILAESHLASCEKLTEIYAPKLEADPGNASLAATVVRMMNSAEDCAGNELYFKAVTTLHRLDPSYRSAYALYRMNAERGNHEEAVSYLEQALDSSELTDAEAAQYAYELALYAYKTRMRAKAAEAAMRAVELDEGYAGRAYIVLGNLWSSAPADGEIARYARYWVAADYYQKARSADPALAEEAGQLIAGVSRYYPDASEVFMYDLVAGQTYRAAAGGLSATTTVKVK